MAHTVPQTRTYKDVIGFTDGVNSYVDPQFVGDTQVRWAENSVNKGGIWQTRPGFDSVLSLLYNASSGDFYNWWFNNGTPDVYPQFFTFFQPTNGNPQLLFGLSGAVFYCNINHDGTISNPVLIPQIKFSDKADQICAVNTVRTSTLQNGRVWVTAPQNILIMQDGVSRACYWDGVAAGTLNPVKKWKTDDQGNTIYVDGYNQTRLGLWMAWSGNRLWVANGTQVFASDLGDPLTFTDETVLVNIPSFNFPSPVTGLIDRGASGVQQNMLFVGTTTGIFTIQSGIQQRSQWISVADFQRKVFAGVGCVSHKSMINHMGLLHWYSDNGIVAFDSFGTVVSTQALPPIDSEMAYSKQQMSGNRSGICAGSFDSYVWWSVPVAIKPSNPEYKATYRGRIYNGHTQVLDRIVMPVGFNISAGSSFGSSAWQGVWTGLRPVEWATAVINGQKKVYCLSIDYDGVIRVWKAFNGNRADNNQPVSWTIETKSHAVTDGPFSKSVFRTFRLLMTQIYGGVTIEGFWKGLRGKYHQLLDTSVMATPGSVLLDNPDYTPIINATNHESFAKQTRDIRAKDNRAQETCTSANVEDKDQDDIDRAFSLLLRFTGIGALKAYRITVDYNPDNTEGEVLDPETGQHILPEASCPEYVPNGSQDYSLVERSSAEALVPIASNYIETGYTPTYPS